MIKKYITFICNMNNFIDINLICIQKQLFEISCKLPAYKINQCPIMRLKKVSTIPSF